MYKNTMKRINTIMDSHIAVIVLHNHTCNVQDLSKPRCFFLPSKMFHSLNTAKGSLIQSSFLQGLLLVS